MYREIIRDALKMPRFKKNKIFYKENLVLGARFSIFFNEKLLCIPGVPQMCAPSSNMNSKSH